MTVATSRDYGKPRPAVIVQTNALGDTHDSVIVCQMTSFTMPPVDFRLALKPSTTNGLRVPSQIMVDKPVAVRRDRVGKIIGELDQQDVQRLNEILTFVMGLSE